MVLAIDIGNSNIVIGEWAGEKLRFVSRVETDKSMTEDSYAVRLKNILELYGVEFEAVEGSIVSSVVPQLTRAVTNAVGRLTGKPPLLVGPGIKTGLNIRIDDPAELGSDLAVDAVAALAKYPAPIVIFDMGTATTMSVLDAEGNFLGGSIMPGLRVGLDALALNAAALPQVGFDRPRDIIGRNTIESMRSGAVYGTASMLDGLADRMEKRLGRPVSVVATGGNARDIVPFCERKIHYDADLLLEGLLLLYRRNTAP